MALWIGLYPKPFFEILGQPVNQLARSVQEGAKNPNVVAGGAEVTPAPVNFAAPSEATKGKD